MRIAVITDAHANLPALEAALEAIHREGCDAIVHTGDALAIGPYPAECLDLLLNTPDVRLLMGNDESWFVEGLPEPQPAWMSDGEVEHQQWMHAQLSPALRSVIAQWPYTLEDELHGVRTTFAHYPLAPLSRDFAPLARHPTASDLDRMFSPYRAALIFFGHDHSASDVRGRARYVNPGSLGCCTQAIARYCVAEFHRGQYTVAHRAVAYDDAALFRAFEARHVPARQFIYEAFFGGRFGA